MPLVTKAKVGVAMSKAVMATKKATQRNCSWVTHGIHNTDSLGMIVSKTAETSVCIAKGKQILANAMNKTEPQEDQFFHAIATMMAKEPECDVSSGATSSNKDLEQISSDAVE